MPRGPGTRSTLGSALALLGLTLGIAALILASSMVTMLVIVPPALIGAIWPLTGISLGFVLARGLRALPGILLATSTMAVWATDAGSPEAMNWHTAGSSALLVVGAALDALLGAWAIRRFAGYPNALQRPRDVGLFWVCGAAPALLGSALTAGAMVALQDLPVEIAAGLVPQDWFGRSMAVAAVTPIVLAAVGEPREAWRRRRGPAVALVAALLLLVRMHGFLADQERARLARDLEERTALIGVALEHQIDDRVAALRGLANAAGAGLASDPGTLEALAAMGTDDRHEISFAWLLPGRELRQDDRRPTMDEEVWRLLRAVQDRARREVTLSPKLDHDGTSGGRFVLTHPVRGLDGADEAAGFVAAEVAGEVLVAPAMEPGPASPRRELWDATEAPAVPITSVEARTGPPTPVERAWHPRVSGGYRPVPRRVARWGRTWELVLSPAPDYLDRHASRPARVLVVGSVTAVGFFGLMLLVLSGQWVTEARRSRDLEEANDALAREIGERRRTERALAEEKERAEVTLHSIADAVVRTDAEGLVEYLNPIAEELTGFLEAEAAGRPLRDVFAVTDPDSGEALAPPAPMPSERRAHPSPRHGVLDGRHGRRTVVRYTTSPIEGAERALLGYVLAFSDVTEQQRMAREVAHQARHDALTGLVNRREFERLTGRALADTRGHGRPAALCYLDLDQFKLVNDTAGHVAGDELLRIVAAALQRQLRHGDVLARLGGDEFGLLLRDCELATAVAVAGRLVDGVRSLRFEWAGRSFQIGVSVGLVGLTVDIADVTELLARADVACYTAKDLGRSRVHCYDPGTDAEGVAEQRRAELFRVTELQGALDRDRLRLFGQPIVPLRGGATRPHYEVLLRMQDASGGLISPGRFIPAAERYGLMTSIDRWVVATSFAIGAWARREMSLSINLSGSSLGDPELEELVRRRLLDSTVDPEAVCFEITETAAIGNMARAVRFMHGMKELGCRFALDDFGTGVSSLGYLKDLPVDFLKIDGSFIVGMDTDPSKAMMVRAMNDLAHGLGVRTIAEWVEGPAVLELLRGLGVDFAQGYALGRPTPLA